MQNKALLIILGIMFFGIGVMLNYGSFKMLFTGEKVTGTIVDYEYKSKSGYALVVSYTTKDKKNITEHSNIYSSHRPYKEGKEVTVYYDKNNPSNMIIGTFSEMWMFGTIFMFMGGLVICLSIKKTPY